MPEAPNKKTIDYIAERVEVILPQQIEAASRILGRLTMQYHGQLQFEFEEHDAV